MSTQNILKQECYVPNELGILLEKYKQLETQLVKVRQEIKCRDQDLLDVCKELTEKDKEIIELKTELMGKEIGYIHSLDYYKDEIKELQLLLKESVGLIEEMIDYRDKEEHDKMLNLVAKIKGEIE